MPRLTETRAQRAKLPQAGSAYEMCSEVKGFGVRLTANGARTYIIRPTLHDGSRPTIIIGPVSVMSFEGPQDSPGAVDLAKIGLAAARRRGSADVVKEAMLGALKPKGATLDDIWLAYATAGFPKLRRGKSIEMKRPSTIKADGDRYTKHLKPKIGRIPLVDLDDKAIGRWLDTIASEGQKSQCLTLFKTVQSFALFARGLVPE